MPPPCLGNLQWQTQRANYVTYIGRYAHMLQFELDSPSLHGWNEDRTPRWMDEFFPSNIQDVLIAANEKKDHKEDNDEDEEEDYDKEENEVIDDENDADMELEDFG